jgi:hypothetical protein
MHALESFYGTQRNEFTINLAPRIVNCPKEYTRVMVEVQEQSNVALLYHRFHAIDFLGEELYVNVSQQKFYACNCAFGQRVRANATTVDRHGGKATCCFTVEIVGKIDIS